MEADPFIPGDLPMVGVGNQLQVGDPGRWRRRRLDSLGPSLRMRVTGDAVRHRPQALTSWNYAATVGRRVRVAFNAFARIDAMYGSSD